MDIEVGDCVAGFLVLRDENGALHGIKPHAVLGVHQADPSDDQTILSLPGGRVVILDQGFRDTLHTLASLPAPRR